MIKTWKSYKKRIMYKKGIRHFSKYERSGKRFIWAQFMFQISMDERREFWLNDYKKFVDTLLDRLNDVSQLSCDG